MVLSYFYAQPSIAFKQFGLEVIFMALTDEVLQDINVKVDTRRKKTAIKTIRSSSRNR